MPTKTDHAREQAQAQLEHIRQLVEWFDHARECSGYDETDQDGERECVWANTIAEEHVGMPTDTADVHDAERVTEAIHEHPLSVEVREGWHDVGHHADNDSPSNHHDEFRILLCTGGPAVRIVGDLNNYGEPESARIEYQDWGTPWTEYIQYDDSAGDVLRYCGQFYFGS